jgi:MFS family permease
MDDDLPVGTAAPTPAAAPAPLAPAGRWATFLRRSTDGLPAPFWWLWLGTLVNRAGTFIEPFFVLYLTGPRDVSIRTAGYVLTLWGVGSLLSQPVGGFLTDRFGRRWTLAVSLAATAAALASLGMARGLVLIAALGFVVGLVGDMYRPAATAAIADVVADDDRERAYALQFWAINLGFSVASVAAGVLLHFGFATLFVLDALTTFAFGLLALRFVPETRPGTTERPAQLADPLRVLRTDRLLLAATLIMLVYAVLYGQVTVVLPLAITHSGLSASVFGYVVAINGVLIVVLQPLAIGWLSGVPRRRTVPLGLALVGVGLAATTYCHSPWQFALTVIVWTLGEIAVSGSFQATIAALAPAHMRGRYAGALGLAWGASDLLAPIIGTSLYAFSPGLTSICCLAAGVGAAVGQHWLLGAIPARLGRIAA